MNVIKNADMNLLFLVLLLTFVNIFLQFLKWKTVCLALLNTCDNNRVLKSLFYGYTGGILTPIRVGEFLGRKLALGEHGLVKVTISTLIDKFAFLYFVIVIGGITTAGFLLNYSVYYSGILIILIVLFILLSIFIIKKTDRFQFIIDRIPQNYSFLKDVKLELEYVNRMDSKELRNLLKYSLLLYSVIILQYSLLAKSFDQSGDMIIFLSAACTILFVKSFLSFLSFADLGIRETTSVLLLKYLGYSGAVGFNSAFFLYFFNVLIPSIAGLFLLFRSNKKRIDYE